MKFSTRLLSVIFIVIVAFAGVTFVTLRLLAQTEQTQEVNALLNDLSNRSWRLQSLTYRLLVDRDSQQAVEAYRVESARMLPVIERLNANEAVARIASTDEEFARNIAGITSLTELVQRELARLDEALIEVTNEFSVFPELRPDRRNDDVPPYEWMQLDNGVRSLASYLDNTFQGVVERSIARLDQLQQSGTRFLQYVFLGVIGVALALVTLILVLIARTIRGRFKAIQGSMQDVADGDLTVELVTKKRDEIGVLAGSIQRSIRGFSHVVSGVQQISAAVEGLKENLVASAEESAASISEIGSTVASIAGVVEDLDTTIKSTGERLREINEVVVELEERIGSQTRSVAESSSAVEQMTAGITSVSKITEDRAEGSKRLKHATEAGHGNIAKTDERVDAIAKSIEETLGIITVINTIASQTNILSMNAAIEAAHAGEAGRGFSVVAEEIRRLSESTNENAKRIKTQLLEVEELAKETQEASGTTRESFAEVEDEVTKTNNAFEEISATMRELAEGTNTVLASTTVVGELTNTIRDEATRVSSRSHAILSDMGQVEGISQTVRNGIEEIRIGTTELEQMIANLTQVTQGTTDTIERLSASVEHIKVSGNGSSVGLSKIDSHP
ncbi:MAG: methyl-accepting chemotaxis protein [Spirochaetales bacterium]